MSKRIKKFCHSYLLKYKENVIVVEKVGINLHNAGIKINQKMNGLSTKYNSPKTLQKI